MMHPHNGFAGPGLNSRAGSGPGGDCQDSHPSSLPSGRPEPRTHFIGNPRWPVHPMRLLAIALALISLPWTLGVWQIGAWIVGLLRGLA